MKQSETKENIKTLKEKLKQKLIVHRYSDVSHGNYINKSGSIIKV